MKIRNSNTKQILKYLAVGGVITVLSLANPQLPYFLLKAYIKRRKFQRRLFLQDLRRLQKRELIDYKEMPNGQIKLIIKNRGKQQVIRANLDDIQIKKPSSWDRKWRLITFDIPDRKRKASIAFGKKLKEMGFYRLQKSIYIYPFPCENEINFITSVFNINNHILMLNVSDFDGDAKLKYRFNL